MGPRTMPLPSAQTESARELRRAFFCELCQKGYARINELEAHENSYDHQHRKRLKEMQALTRTTTKTNREARKKGERGEMVSMNLQQGESGQGRRGMGFRDEVGERSAGGFKAAVSEAPARGFVPVGGAETKPVETSKDTSASHRERRPIEWEELDRFYELVDSSKLPAEMQQQESTGYMKMLEEWQTDPERKVAWCQNIYGLMQGMQSDTERIMWRTYEEEENENEGSDLFDSDSD